MLSRLSGKVVDSPSLMVFKTTGCDLGQPVLADHILTRWSLRDYVLVQAVEKKRGNLPAKKACCQHGIFLFALISLMPMESYASFSHFCILANMYIPNFHIISAPSFALQNTPTCVQHHSTMLLSQSVSKAVLWEIMHSYPWTMLTSVPHCPCNYLQDLFCVFF